MESRGRDNKIESEKEQQKTGEKREHKREREERATWRGILERDGDGEKTGKGKGTGWIRDRAKWK